LDDYDEDKYFHRILYKPGFAVQARELIQQQTILQNQISRVGRHLFDEGAMLIPGYISYDSDVSFCRLDTGNIANTNIATIEALETFWLNNIVENANGVKAQVIAIDPANVNGFVTLFLKYTSGSTDGLTTKFAEGETITTGAETGVIISGAVQDGVGIGSAATIAEGIYFARGFALKVNAQRVVLDADSQTPTKSAGLRVIESIVTFEEDESLLDNATGTPNFSAPGADRLKIELVLEAVDIADAQSDDFIELLRVENGTVVKKVDRTSFNIIGDEMASRTFDESGNYTVDPWIAEIQEHPTDNTKLQIVLDPGKAFIRGYEVETIAKTTLDLDKATETEQRSSISINAELGNYVRANNLHGVPFIDEYAVCQLRDLPTASPHVAAGTQIGTARIRTILHADGDAGTAAGVYNIYLFDINLDAGKTFENVQQIYQPNPGVGADDFTCDTGVNETQLTGTVTEIAGGGPYILTSSGGTGWKNIDGQRLEVGNVLKITQAGLETFVVVSTVTSDTEIEVTYLSGDGLSAGTTSALLFKTFGFLFETNLNSLLFALPSERIETIRDASDLIDTSYVVNRYFHVPGNVGDIDLSLALAGEEFDSDNEADIIVYDYTNDSLVNGFSATGAGTANLSISGGAPSIGAASYVVIAPIRKFAPTGTELAAKEKTKTLVTNSTVVLAAVDDKKNISLGKADIYRLVSVVDDLAGDVTDRYTLDNGQRDNFYGVGTVNLLQGQSEPTGNVTVTFDYFSHGSNGNYFSVDSYTTAGLDFDEIPKYFSPNSGQTISLADVLDFRPRIDDTGSGFDLAGASFTEIPVDRVIADYRFFLPRIDQLVISPQGEFSIIQGAAAENPQTPSPNENSMSLYNIGMVANTTNPDDVLLEYIENKRYTMRDIGRLEERIETLEYYTELSLLEKETADLEILDANGLNRFKNGFLVDSFDDHGIGDVLDEDYKIAIDFNNGEARPMAVTENVNMIFDDGESSNVQQTTDVALLPYGDFQYITQDIATSAINVNPFNVFNFLGTVKLTPDTDQWRDTEILPPLVTTIDQYSTAVANFERAGTLGTFWGEWEDTWHGEWKRTGREVLSRKITKRRTREQEERQTAKRRRRIKKGLPTKIAPGRGLELRETKVRVTKTQRVGQTREGFKVRAVPKIVTKDLGEKTVNVAYIPFMRANNVVVEATTFKPSTKLYGFFDETDVNDYCCFVGEFDDGSGTLIYPDFYVKEFRSTNAGNTYERLTIDFDPVGPSKSWTEEELVNQIITDQKGNRIHIIKVETAGTSPTVIATYDFKKGSGLSAGVSQFSMAAQTTPAAPVDPFVLQVDTFTSVSREVPDIITDETGACKVAFRVPNPNDDLTKEFDPNLKFKTGSRSFELSDDPQRNIISTTSGSAQYFAQGLLEQRRSSILSIKTAVLVREAVQDTREIDRTKTNIRVKKKWIDPVAQSFLVTEEGGVYLTKIHVYFRTKDPSIPVSLEVRETVAGIPGSLVVPFSQVTVASDDVHTNVVIDNNTLEVDGVPVLEGVTEYQKDSNGNFLRDAENQLIPVATDDEITATHINKNFVPTVFEFETPIYLEEAAEYAFIVMANSNNYEIWRANAKNPNPENRVGTNIPVSENPYAGSMFKSQNASTWTPEQSSDLMFRLYRAKFNTLSGTAVFKNETNSLPPLHPAHYTRLVNNPFETVAGSDIVRVSHRNHGLSNDDLVIILDASEDQDDLDGTINGIPSSEFNTIHQISNATLDSYTIQTTTVADETGFSGGAFVRATKNIPYEIIRVVADTITPHDTSVVWSLTTTTRKHPYNFPGNPAQQGYGPDGPFNIVPNEDITFNSPRMVAGIPNEANFLSGNESLKLEAALLSNKDTLSPVIGTQRISATTIASRIDNVNFEGNGATNVAELDQVERLGQNLSGYTVGDAAVDFDVNTSGDLELSYDVVEEFGASLNNIVVGNYVELTSVDVPANNGTWLCVDKEYSPGGAPEIILTLRSIDGQTPTAGTEDDAVAGDFELIQYKNFVDEIAPTGCSHQARYITKRMILAEPAVGLRISVAAAVSEGSEIEVYYKIQTDDSKDFDDLTYELAIVDQQPPFAEDALDFRDYVYTINNLPEYTVCGFKIVLKGDNPATPVILKDFRAIALGT
jgi:hypothetical protein